jgi:hypothetical protein
VPDDTPPKVPVPSIVASDDRPVDHVPPLAESCNAMDCPTHTIGPPVMAGGGGSTVTSAGTGQPAALL